MVLNLECPVNNSFGRTKMLLRNRLSTAFFLAGVVALVVFAGHGGVAAEFQPAPAKLVNVRDGLGNVLAKLDEVTAPITASPRCRLPRDSIRQRRTRCGSSSIPSNRIVRRWPVV